MPRRKKQFIDKKKGQTFTLMHRSQRDPRYYEEGASKFVFVPSERPANHPRAEGDAELFAEPAHGRGGEAGGASESKSDGRIAGGAKVALAKGPGGVVELREVDEYGMPLDGYDYSQHMREMGGGTFISADGTVYKDGIHTSRGAGEGGGAGDEAGGDGDVEAPEFVMPEDLMASGEEIDLSLLRGITTTTESMPEDVRAALEGDGEEGEFEELDDDFFEEAMKPAKDEFDFDAHIKMLLAKADEGGRTAPRKDGTFDDDDSDEEYSDYPTDEDEADGGGAGAAGAGAAHDEGAEAAGAGGGAHSADPRERDLAGGDSYDEGDGSAAVEPEADTREKRFIDDHLDVVLEQYDDDQFGELDDEDPALEGKGVLPAVLASAIDDFYMQSKRVGIEEAYADDELGAAATEGAKAAIQREAEAEAADGGASDDGEVPLVGRAANLRYDVGATRREREEEAEEMELGPAIGAKRGGYDAETIVSTYTTTEHHPKLLDDAKGSSKVIRLSRKTGMPIVESAAAGGKKGKIKGARGGANGNGGGSADDDAGSDAGSYDDEVAGAAGAGDDASIGGGSASLRMSPIIPAEPTGARPKGESRDDKRARKQAVKAARRAKREAKKSLKEAFKEEEKKIKGTGARVKAGGGKSVFQYA